jgi:hypothetical protein
LATLYILIFSIASLFYNSSTILTTEILKEWQFLFLYEDEVIIEVATLALEQEYPTAFDVVIIADSLKNVNCFKKITYKIN